MKTKREILERLSRREIDAKEAMLLLKNLDVDATNPVQDKPPITSDREKQNRNQPSGELQGKPKDIAIIGLSGQFPDADNIHDYWTNIETGKDSISEVPGSRWNAAELNALPKSDPRYISSRWGGFLNNAHYFDRKFFNLSPREASQMEPQQRLFLQEAWKAFEHAGYTDAALSERACGVYVGYTGSDYRLAMRDAHAKVDVHTMNGSAGSILAARIAYYLNLRGPSLAVDTACSSSLVAAHLACEALWNRSIDMALVGGVSLLITPDFHQLSSKMGMLAADGRCKTFDDAADGFVPAEGVAAIVLKRLEDAQRDGDYIHATIKAIGLNQDGRTNGVNAPSAPSQTALKSQIYGAFGIAPESIGYFEAHGTGTRLGDPIEVEAATQAFTQKSTRLQFCAMGSVKANIGHTLAVAGLAGLIKVVQSLRHQRWAPSINIHHHNSLINFSNSPFFTVERAQHWPLPESGVRRGAVSSFGFSGTNAHAVLEQAPPHIGSEKAGPYLMLLSAKSEHSLKQLLHRLKDWLSSAEGQHTTASDIAYSLQCRRNHFSKRCALLVNGKEHLSQLLTEILEGGEPANVWHGNVLQKIEQWEAEGKQAYLALQSLKGEGTQQNAEASWINLAQWHTQGVEIPWQELYASGEAHTVPLPNTYFEREYFDFVDPDTRVDANQKIDNPVHRITQDDTSTEWDLSENPVVDSTLDSAPQDSLRQHFQEIVAAVMKLQPAELDLAQPLNSHGLDSMMIVEIVNELRKTYTLNVDAAEMFGFPSLLAFIDEYQQRLKEADKPVTRPVTTSGAAAGGQSTPTRQNEKASNADNLIAVVGMAGCLPESEDLEAFWQQLESGKNMISEVPALRWSWRDYYGNPLQEPGKTQIKYGGFIPNIEYFDALFFGISPREAEIMDPQQRLFLQQAWKAIEDAGHAPESLRGSQTGVFVGASTVDYSEYLRKRDVALIPQAVTATARSLIANRLSYLLDLKGPSEVVDTACSSSLVALNRAVLALQKGECEQALVGGVHVMLDPELFVVADQAGMLNPQGQCRTFDKDANGYVRGEGVIALMLKPLAQAHANGDSIHGVIRASVVNHGGMAQSLTAPNPLAQANLIQEAYRQANVSPRTVNYIEAHGTGTALGDPIEINGLKKAFDALQKSTLQKDEHSEATSLDAMAPTEVPWCAISSVKTNIGHLEAAAGLAGLVKVLLSMKAKKIPQNIHLNQVNPQINLAQSPFYLVKEACPWKRLSDKHGNALPRRASLSSFGYGGVNAHILLEEYLEKAAVKDSNNSGQIETFTSSPMAFCLSARDHDALRTYAASLLQFIQNQKEKQPLKTGPSAKQLRSEISAICASLLEIPVDELLTEQIAHELLMQHGTVERLVEKLNERWQLQLRRVDLREARSIEELLGRIMQEILPKGENTDQQKDIDSSVRDWSLQSLLLTLQIGRDPMEERLSFVACSVDEMLDRLKDMLDGKSEHILIGNIRRDKEKRQAMDYIPPQQGTKFSRESAHQLALFWSLGGEVNWRQYYPQMLKENGYQRMHLPTYPFVPERHWPDNPLNKIPDVTQRLSLVDSPYQIELRECSDDRKFIYNLTFSGNEFFLSDHQLQDQKILPGVVYLDIALNAANTHMEKPKGDEKVCLRDIHWLQPIIMTDSPRVILLELTKKAGERAIQYRFMAEALVFATGRIEYQRLDTTIKEDIDIVYLTQTLAPFLPGSSWYQRFRQADFHYGSSMQVIEQMAGLKAESLSYLDSSIIEDKDMFELHPAIMDGAFQSLGALLNQKQTEHDAHSPLTFVPFALDELLVYQRPLNADYVYVKERLTDGQSDRNIRLFDLSLCDKTGSVLVSLRGLSVRSYRQASTNQSNRQAQPTQTDNGSESKKASLTRLYARALWGERKASSNAKATQGDILFLVKNTEELAFYSREFQSRGYSSEQLLFVLASDSCQQLSPNVYSVAAEQEDYFDLLTRLLGSRQMPSNIIHLWSGESPAIDASSSREQHWQSLLVNSYFSLASLCQTLIRRKVKHPQRILYVYPKVSSVDGPASVIIDQPINAAVSGLARTLALESTNVQLTCLELPSEALKGSLLADMSEPTTPQHHIDHLIFELSHHDESSLEVAYREGKRFTRHLDIVDVEEKNQ